MVNSLRLSYNVCVCNNDSAASSLALLFDRIISKQNNIFIIFPTTYNADGVSRGCHTGGAYCCDVPIKELYYVNIVLQLNSNCDA